MGKVTLDLHNGNGGGSQPPQEPEHLYEKRKQIYPKLAHGPFRSLKWLAMVVMLGVYYAVPWIRWDRGEGISNQAVHADFESEKFYFFFIEIWPQDIHYLAGLLILATLGLFLITSLLGRVWCGYACPQTVWTDLYIWVERALEGDRAARMRLDRGPMTINKFLRKTAKHFIWLLIAFVTGGAFILYWHDAPTIAQTFLTGEAPLTAYWFTGVLTLTTYFLAAHMREQVCIYMCPWPRIQGALTDEHALNVTYRYDRGEPRGPKRKDQDWSDRGDCISCNQCVQVCPVGIDIRDGAQLECIHCALCIDACDEMMVKVGRPKGLIAYDTDVAVEARACGKTAPKFKVLRVRTILYAILMSIISILIVFGYSTKATLELNVLKDRSPPFVQLATGDIRNGYTVKLVNKEAGERDLMLDIAGPDGMTYKVVGFDTEGLTEASELSVRSFGVDRYRILVTAPNGRAQRQVTFTLTDPENGEVITTRSSLRGPGQ